MKYQIVVSDKFDRIIKKLSQTKPTVFKSLKKQILKIVANPNLGKPLRNILKNCRRVHIRPFVLIYEILNRIITWLSFMLRWILPG